MLRKYRKLVYKKIIKAHLFDDEEDCFQKCMVTVYKCILNFNDGNTFYSYVNTAVTNTIRSVYKKNLERHSQEVVVDDLYLRETTPFDSGADLKILQCLNPKEKLFIKLVYLEKRTAQELSEEYGITKYAIYNILKRAKKKIKDNIY